MVDDLQSVLEFLAIMLAVAMVLGSYWSMAGNAIGVPILTTVIVLGGAYAVGARWLWKRQ